MIAEGAGVSAAEVRRRLRRRAAELGLDFQQAILYYAVERFLCRVSMTDYADRLILKGATLLRVWDGAIARPTRDVDFLGRVGNTPEAVEGAVRACLQVEVPDDGLVFDPSLSSEAIAVQDRYPGLRIKTRGHLDGARFVLRLDVGIDDATVPDPGWVDYPTLLEGPSPRILAYHPATAVAEKFEAIVSLGEVNSRMKDFYDLWTLATTQRFAGAELRDAIAATFTKRRTPIPTSPPISLTGGFAAREGTQTLWAAFARRLATSGIGAAQDLGEVVSVVEAFIMPAAQAAAAGKLFDEEWTAESGWRS